MFHRNKREPVNNSQLLLKSKLAHTCHIKYCSEQINNPLSESQRLTAFSCGVSKAATPSMGAICLRSWQHALHLSDVDPSKSRKRWSFVTSIDARIILNRHLPSLRWSRSPPLAATLSTKRAGIVQGPAWSVVRWDGISMQKSDKRMAV